MRINTISLTTNTGSARLKLSLNLILYLITEADDQTDLSAQKKKTTKEPRIQKKNEETSRKKSA